MRPLGILPSVIMVLLLAVLPVDGIGKVQNDAEVEALNRYLDFTNECLHVLYAFREDLEELNKSMVLAIEQEESLTPAYDFSDYYRNDRFFTFLQGTCARTSEDLDAGIELRVLYQWTRNNQALPEQQRIELNRYRDQIWYLMLEFFDKNYTLATEVNRPRQRGDVFGDLFVILDDISSIYLQVDEEIASFRDYLDRILPPLPEALRPFKSLTVNGEALLHAVLQEDEAAIFASRQALLQSITVSKSTRERNARQLRQLGISFNEEEEQAYDHGIEYGELLLARTKPEVLQGGVRKSWDRYPTSYHHYNRRLIDIYNHHKYGLTSYYKSLIKQANQLYPYPLDVTPIYLVIRPEEPEEVVVIAEPEPEVEEAVEENVLTLEAAPTNNLVFLIDVSASMNSSDKLPVLKENLEYLVSLFRAEDKIALVTFAGDASVVLEATSGNFPSEIKTAIRGIRTGGETKVKKGFREAYRIAEEEFIFNGTNRVILITDGIFQTDRSLESTISRGAGKGIQLSVMLLGRREAPQVRTRLSQLSELGEGKYSHLKTSTAKEVLVREARGE